MPSTRSLGSLYRARFLWNSAPSRGRCHADTYSLGIASHLFVTLLIQILLSPLCVEYNVTARLGQFGITYCSLLKEGTCLLGNVSLRYLGARLGDQREESNVVEAAWELERVWASSFQWQTFSPILLHPHPCQGMPYTFACQRSFIFPLCIRINIVYDIYSCRSNLLFPRMTLINYTIAFSRV